jgi:glycosyltransferase involved in cell wall biosynthesis
MPEYFPGNTSKKISVIVPMYNGELYIAEAIESILSQTVPVSEIFVVDDGSTDNGCEIVAQYKNAVLLKKNHSGINDTLNYGLQHAGGEFISFLDADDRWLATKTERQLDILSKDAAVDMVFGHAERFQSIEEDGFVRDVIIDRMPGLVLQGGLFRKSAFDCVGVFSSDPNRNSFMDWYARALSADLKFVFHDDIVFQRRLHGNNYTLLNKDALLKGYLSALKASVDRKRNKI